MDGNLAMNRHIESLSEKEDAEAYEAHLIKRGNILIANYMEWVHHSNKDVDKYEMENLKYHKSWDCLMPVIEKIEKDGWNVVIENGICHIFSEDFPSNKLEFANKSNNNSVGKILLVWNTVVDYLFQSSNEG